MTGQFIKQKLKDEGVNLRFLTKQLGYANDQNLHGILSKDDVRSSVIEKIAMAIGKPVGWFYGECKQGMISHSETGSATAGDNGIAISGGTNNISSISERFIGLLEEKDRQIREKDAQINERDKHVSRLIRVLSRINLNENE